MSGAPDPTTLTLDGEAHRERRRLLAPLFHGDALGAMTPVIRDVTGEVSMATYAHFADRDPLTKVVLAQMLAGVSTRRFARTT